MDSAAKAAQQSEIDNMFERNIIDLGIPPYPVILKRFRDESSKDDPDFNRLAEIIMSDVSLSAGLIKTANSPFFGMRKKVRSAHEAIVILGLMTTSSAVAGIILRNSFPTVPNLERFWDASGRIALLSGWLAQKLSIVGLLSEDAYTFGLFRDCGIPVVLRWFPKYQGILEEANQNSEQSFIEVEQSKLPTNHAKVGSVLARSWLLPEEMCSAIRNHHDLAILESDSAEVTLPGRRLIAVSQLAEYIVQQQLNLSLTQEWPKLGAACLKLLNLNGEQLENILAEAKHDHE